MIDDGIGKKRQSHGDGMFVSDLDSKLCLAGPDHSVSKETLADFTEYTLDK